MRLDPPPALPDGEAEAGPPLRLQLQFTSANSWASCKALWELTLTLTLTLTLSLTLSLTLTLTKALWEVSGVPREAWAAH